MKCRYTPLFHEIDFNYFTVSDARFRYPVCRVKDSRSILVPIQTVFLNLT